MPGETLVKQLLKERFKLCDRIGLLKEAPARNKLPGHIIGKSTSRGVDYRQVGPETNRLIGHVVATERQCMKAYIDEKDIDMARGREIQKRTSKVARQHRFMAQIFNHPCLSA